MKGRQVGRVNQQSKGETPLMSGVLQRAAVRAVAEKDVEAIQEVVSERLSQSRFVHDFSQTQMPIDRGVYPPYQSLGEGVKQKKGEMTGNSQVSSKVSRPNKTGLPDNLKTSIENLSGMAMDDVKVHYNSDKPTQLQAYAYAQGTEIHVASGQEKHLPHEAWHVVQQKQGRVKPTMQMKGEVNINDDRGLEKEADVMGEKATLFQLQKNTNPPQINGHALNSNVIQRNAIISHNFEINENPIKTVTRFVSRNTGFSEDKVFDAIAYPSDKKYKKALRDEGDIKPISVKAYITEVTGSADREKSDIQTATGWLGNLEDSLRGRGNAITYDGGHLLGYGWYSDWDLINTAKNIAPQDKKENRSIFGDNGGWGKEEENARKINNLAPLLVTAYVNYAGGTYTVSLQNIADTMFMESSEVWKAIDAMSSSQFRFVVLNARVPKQYVLEHTVMNVPGVDSGLINENLKSGLLTVWMPTRIPRMLLSPIEDSILRNMLPIWQSSGDRGRWGGAVVSQNQPQYMVDVLSDAMKLAQFAIYYYMYTHNLTMVAAAAVVARYFGSGTASSSLQLLLNAGFSVIGLKKLIPYLEVFTTIETTLTVDTVIGYSKSVVAYLTSQTINYGTMLGEKMKKD
ncbi:DUF4157 domain-containing protein [Microcoleus sp.]|uniref:DUF4157 domain-containing protein n=1 Tax=Microcoleus sp. TaxID=44472 RepID=UPI00403EEF03